MAEKEYQHVPRAKDEALALMTDLSTPLDGNVYRDINAILLKMIIDNMVASGYTDLDVVWSRGPFKSLKDRLDAGDADMRNISVNWINKNLGKLDQTFMTDEFLQMMAGTTPINAVPTDGSLTTEKFADNSVTLDKIRDKEVAGQQRTINLFNKSDVGIESGGYYNGATWVPSSAHSVSGLIPVDPNTGYTFLYANNANPVRARIYFYDKNGNYVSGGTGQSTKLTATAHPYIRFHFLNSAINSLMMIKDSDLPSNFLVPYTPYKVDRYKLKSAWGVGEDNIVDKSVTADKLSDVVKSVRKTINLFDKTDPNIRTGGYYNGNVWVEVPGTAVSGLVPVEPGEGYSFFDRNPPEQVGARIRYHNADGSYAAGGTTFSSKLNGTTYPYVTFTFTTGRLDTVMMIKDSDIPSNLEYVPYGETPLNKFNDNWDVLDSTYLLKIEKKINDADSGSKLYTQEYTAGQKLNLPDFSGYNQAWHPSVLYISGGFGGAPYWLAQSPYPNGGLPSRVRWEVPVIYKSNNGVDWTVVANPLDDLTQAEIERGDYMSDPELVYREDLGRLECWYRHSVGTGDLPTTVFRKHTTDGVVWSEREVMIPAKVSTDDLFFRSHSVIFADGKYKAYFTNDSRNLFARPLLYSEAVDGKNWSTPVECPVDIYRTPWHTSVTYFDNLYHYIVYYRPINWPNFRGIGQSLFYYTSEDGRNFKFVRTIMADTDNNSTSFYKNGLYRSVAIKGHDSKLRLYFSFVDADGKNSIGLATGDAMSYINPVKRVDGRTVVARTGESLDDLVIKLDRLRLDFDKL